MGKGSCAVINTKAIIQGREGNSETGAASRWHIAKLGPVALAKLPGNIQAQPGAVTAGCVKGLKNLLAQSGFQPGPRILHFQKRPPGILAQARFEFQQGGIACVLQTVLAKIPHHLMELARVYLHLQLPGLDAPYQTTVRQRMAGDKLLGKGFKPGA